MSEPAPSAAGGPSAAEVSRRVCWLSMRWLNGRTYRLAKDRELGWCVLDRGGRGLLAIAPDLTELGEKLTAVVGTGAGGAPS